MKQRIFNRIFLFLLFFLTWLDFTKFTSIPVSKIGEPIPIFPQIQINLLKSNNPRIIDDAIQETAKMLLKYFVPQLSEESWQSKFIFLDLISDNEPELTLALSLPPDKGILILLQKKDNHYFIASFQDHFSPITKLEELSLKNDLVFLVTIEDQQKQIGALNKASILKLWKWQNNRLQETFSENIHWEINWQNNWENSTPAETPKWYCLTQKFKLTYRWEKEKLYLRTEGKQHFSAAPVNNTAFPAPYDFPSPFRVLKTREISQDYYWDNNWQKFILQTCHYLPPGKITPEEVAVLKDLDKHLESLAFEEPQQYLVINKKGDVFPLNKNDLLINEHSPKALRPHFLQPNSR